MPFLRRFHPASILLGVVLSLCVVGVATPFAISRAEGDGSGVQAATRAVPLTSSFTFQGQLQQTGTPINTPYDFEFRLYSDAAGTTQVPLTPVVTKDNLAVTNGLFTAELDFGAGAFNGDARWLKVSVREGTSVGLHADLTPLQALTATPYALYSQKTGPHNHVGETWSWGLFEFGLTLNGAPGNSVGGLKATADIVGVSGEAGLYGVQGSATEIGVIGFGNGPYGIGTYGTGKSMGVQGFVTTIGAVGVDGYSAQGIGIRASGRETAIVANATAGVGIMATGTAKGPAGAGVVGKSSAPVGTPCLSSAVLAETCLGVYGSATGSSSVGVWGEGQKFGVFGNVPSCPQTACAGIAGATQVVGTWAGRFFGPVVVQTSGAFPGNLDVQGTLTKGAGSFKIDHPQDPANKFLYHSFIESPDMKNLYDGLVTTGADGFATVELPSYFEALNKDFRYQLTVIGDGSWARARVFKKLESGRFVIQTDAPNVEVSWQVTGIRQDAYANDNRIQVEVEKTGDERGHCLYEPACK